MKLSPRLAVAVLFCCGLIVPAVAQTFIWTGVGNGWSGGVAPSGAGGETFVFGDAVRYTIPLPATYTVDTLDFNIDDRFRFVSFGSSTNLTLTGGISAAGTFGANIDFADTINLSLTGNQTWDLGEGGTVMVHGKLSGTGNLTIEGINQSLLLANTTGTPSDFSGTITLNTSASSPVGNFPSLIFWGNDSSSPGLTNIAFGNGGNLITHLAPTLTSNFTFNNGSLLSGQVAYAPIRFRTWDGPATTLSGTVTLANNTTLFGNIGFTNKVSSEFPNNTGARPLPGPISRLPVLISGNVVESGGARSLNITGPGIIILAGTNSYTGGTNVGFSPNLTTGANQNGNGSLIFATQSAIPATGTILSGQANFNNATGYVGIATSAVPNAGDFNTFLTSKVNLTSSGAVGLDSLTGNLPSATPALVTQSVDLSTFTTTATNGIRLGTATSLRLIGPFTPQLNTVYHFGNGGGKLYVLSNLPNLTTSTSLQTTNQGVALMLYLQGANTYTGGTIANNGFIIFDSTTAVPASGTLRAGGSATSVGTSYLGFTDTTLGGIAVNGSNSGGLADADVGLFLKFDQANTWGVIGFDSTNIATPTSVSNLDLTGFNDGVFVGTTTKAVLTGTITPTSVTNVNNTANTYRFTAADGGTLVVDSVLADGAGARSVIVGAPAGFQKMSDGTVVFNAGAGNTYTGGTFINSLGGITVSGATNTAFGTGAISLGTNGGFIGLSAASPGLSFANDIVFTTPGTGSTPQLMFTGSNAFTLTGNISGPPLGNLSGVGSVGLINPTPLNVTVTGNNSGFYGYWLVGNGTLTFGSANAAGGGTLQLDSDAATAAFTTSATLRGITGDNGGHLHLNDGINLTFDTSVLDGDYEFGGAITGPGNVSTTASITVTASTPSELLYLYGANQYSGGTSITNYGVLALGASNSAGSGAITINTVPGMGGLILNESVNLTNGLILTQGVLAGLGTFAPASFNSVNSAPITIGTGQAVFPGVPGGGFFPGKLTFGINTIFADGGSYIWGLQDASFAEGYGTLFITGNLDLNSISVGAFNVVLESYDSFGEGGPAAGITYGDFYSFKIIETGGTISGFNANKFTIDASNFQDGLFPNTVFNLTADAQNVYLNFQAVPEPSTYALLALGSGWAIVGLRRRRRA